MDAETRRFIQEEIKRQVQIITSGVSGANTSQQEDIQDWYPGVATISKRPVMHPFGLASRAPQGTLQVTARMGDHPGNLYVLGHRDKNKPDIQEGEVILYNQFGQQIYLENGKIHIGSKTSSEPLVLGKVFQQMMDTLLDAIAQHTHLGNLGYPTGVPQNATQFTQIKQSPIDDKAILSDKNFTEK